jgi:hypothetical protein
MQRNGGPRRARLVHRALERSGRKIVLGTAVRDPGAILPPSMPQPLDGPCLLHIDRRVANAGGQEILGWGVLFLLVHDRHGGRLVGDPAARECIARTDREYPLLPQLAPVPPNCPVDCRVIELRAATDFPPFLFTRYGIRSWRCDPRS